MPHAPRPVPLRQSYSPDLKARVIYQSQILKKETTAIAVNLNMPLRVVQCVIQTYNELGMVCTRRKGIGRARLMHEDHTCARSFFVQ
jgi:hypothetical protein